MARGNDADVAKAELQKELGISLNAEELIQANQARFPQSLRAASAKRLDPEATEALEASDLKGHHPGKYLDHAVHGDVVVIVYEAKDGRADKVDVPLSDLDLEGDAEPKPKPKPKAEPKADAKADDGKPAKGDDAKG